MKLLVIFGPNLNMVGIRKKEVYGTMSAEDINSMILDYCHNKGVECELFHSNHEGAIIDKIHTVIDDFDGVIINPGAYTHYSYAIRDAIECVEQVPFVEVHMSDISVREEFRKVSVTKDVCVKQIMGNGAQSYLLAVDYLYEVING